MLGANPTFLFSEVTLHFFIPTRKTLIHIFTLFTKRKSRQKEKGLLLLLFLSLKHPTKSYTNYMNFAIAKFKKPGLPALSRADASKP